MMASDDLAEVVDLVQKPATNLNTTTELRWQDSIPQIFACCIIHCVVIQVGASMSFSTILLPQLESNKTDISITISEASWIASLLAVSLPLGSLTSGIVMDRFGRKTLCILTMFPFGASWLLQATATDVWHLYLARVLAGIAGGFSTAALVYVAEVSHPTYRAMFLSLNTFFVSLGILLTCVLGYYFYWRTMAFIFSGVAFATFLLLFLVPESPQWILTFVGDERRTSKALKWFYKKDETFDAQFHILMLSKRNDSMLESNKTSLRQILNVFKEKSVYKPLVILILLFLFQQLSGIYVIIFYAINIFRDIRGDFVVVSVDEYTCVVFLGFMRLIMSVVSVSVSKRFGRRPLLILSAGGMFLSGAGAGLKLDGVFSVVCLLFYISFGALGFVVIPWSLIAELLPVKVRGKLAGLLVAVTYLIMFSIVKSFPFLMKHVNIHSIFLGFASCSFLGMLFIYFCLPETLGKTFEEIERNFI